MTLEEHYKLFDKVIQVLLDQDLNHKQVRSVMNETFNMNLKKRMAELIEHGHTHPQVASITGYCESKISINLTEYYEEKMKPKELSLNSAAV